MSEKRGYVRYTIDGNITLKTEEGGSYVLKIHVTDISFLGVSMYSPEKLDLIGKIVQFELATELSGQTMSGKGKIKYIKEEKKGEVSVFRMGLEFIDVNKDILLEFLQLVQEKLSTRKSKTQHFRRPGEHFGPY